MYIASLVCTCICLIHCKLLHLIPLGSSEILLYRNSVFDTSENVLSGRSESSEHCCENVKSCMNDQIQIADQPNQHIHYLCGK
jgi:hypothetical protein